MRTKTLLFRVIFALTGCLTIVSIALGQTVEERLAKAESAVAGADGSGYAVMARFDTANRHFGATINWPPSEYWSIPRSRCTN